MSDGTLRNCPNTPRTPLSWFVPPVKIESDVMTVTTHFAILRGSLSTPAQVIYLISSFWKLIIIIYPILVFSRMVFNFQSPSNLVLTTAQSLQLTPASQKSAFFTTLMPLHTNERVDCTVIHLMNVWAVNSQLVTLFIVLLASTRQFLSPRTYCLP